MILVDTNIVIDIATKDPYWADWSAQQLELAAGRDDIAINDIVYTELAAGYRRVDELDGVLRLLTLEREEIPKFALFLAGQAFRRYRRQSGRKEGVLSDFFVGAHAVVGGAQVLTRDARRIRAYFPSVPVIAP